MSETIMGADPPTVIGETAPSGDPDRAPLGGSDDAEAWSKDVWSGTARPSKNTRVPSPPPPPPAANHSGPVGREWECQDGVVVGTVRVSNVSSSHWLAMDDCPMAPVAPLSSLYKGGRDNNRRSCVPDACSNEEQPGGVTFDKGTAVVQDGENFQGPNYWRKRLKHVPSLEVAESKRELRREVEQNLDRSLKDRRLLRDDHGDETKARSDKIRISPSGKKELTVIRTKGQLISKPCHQPQNQSPNLMPSKTGRRGSRSHMESESAFTRQVVKPMRSSVIQRNRAIFPSSYIGAKNAAPFVLQFSGKKTTSSHHLETFGNTGQVMAKMVEKVMKARLYLLQQTGPNSFLVGGDSPDHKYRIIIGPQKCSCGRETPCIHLLFVMLRVFQVPQNDPILSRRPLKNYEVEALFRNYHARRTLRLKDNQKIVSRSESQNFNCLKPKSEDGEGDGGDDVDDDDDDDDEDDRESLVTNDPYGNGIGKEEEEELCPICLLSMVDGESLTECKTGCQNRLHHHCIAVWFEECRRQKEPHICPLCRAEWKTDEGDTIVNASTPDLCLHPDAREAARLSVAEEESHPAEPLPPEHAEMAERWIPVVGEDVVVRLFSKNWGVREAALRLLSQEAVGVLLLGVGEGRSGVLVSPERQANNHTMLECCCSILAFSLPDPVYKVFVSGLRALRMILSYTPCRDDQQQMRMQILMKPVVKSLLLKCADSNRKTSQLSISALEELVKGQGGELAVGREIVNPGNEGLGGIGYLIDCIVEIDAVESLHWQWILGRFCMIERLLEEYCHEFTVSLRSTSPESLHSDAISPDCSRTFSILHFCTFHMNFAHIKVSRMARRIFYYITRLQLNNEAVFEKACVLLDDVEPAIQRHMKRKMYSLLEDYRKLPQGKPETSVLVEGTPSDAVLPAMSSEALQTALPQVSIIASSPVTDVVTFVMSTITPSVPDATAPSGSGLGVLESDAVDSPVPAAGESPELTSRGRVGENVAMVDQSPRVEYADACVSTSPLPVHGPDVWPLRDEALDCASLAKCFSLEMRCVSEQHNTAPSQVSDASAGAQDAGGSTNGSPSKIVQPIRTSFAFSKSMGSKESLCDSPPILSACLDAAFSVRRVGLLTEDLSDLLPSSGCEEKVSFKTEVASSPQNSPQRSANNTADDGCHCKEEVEKEEAEALAEALERSDLPQDALPHVPGLSRLKSESTLTIHLQDQNSVVTDEDGFDSRHQYQEDVHWRRGPVLGTGAFSTCYQARDIKTGTLMAVKQISFCRNTLSEQEKVVNAVKEEIHILDRLSHPNIVRILGATQQGCHFFMFVEWMPGCSVASLLDRYGQFSEQVMTSYTLQMLRGLAYLHDQQVLHRDLKGANLLVDSTGHRVRIGDFGAAARLATRLTGAGEFEGQLLGTIAFMAPEVLRGDTYGRKCDIWSFGCTMVEMATAQPPWGANDVSNHLALIFKIASTVRPPPIPENLSPPIRDVMLRCLEVNPEDRPVAKDLLKHPLFRI